MNEYLKFCYIPNDIIVCHFVQFSIIMYKMTRFEGVFSADSIACIERGSGQFIYVLNAYKKF